MHQKFAFTKKYQRKKAAQKFEQPPLKVC